MTQDRPGISVIMAVHNGERYLGRAMESVLGQTFGDFEFIIVDDGSTDGSSAIIRSYADPRIRSVSNGRNIGLTRSLNVALGLASGHYIARQDADDVSLPARFAKQVTYLERHPEVGLLGTGVCIIDEDGRVLRRETPSPYPERKLRMHNQFVHGSVMLRKSVLDQVGPYHELFRYSQDYELWLRIAGRYTVANLTEPLYWKRRHRESVQAQKRREGALYHLLALRIASGRASARLLEQIEEQGIEALYAHLDRKARHYLHRSVARACLSRGDFTAARREYVRAIALAPHDVRNMLSYLMSFLGSRANDGLTGAHHALKSLLSGSRRAGGKEMR